MLAPSPFSKGEAFRHQSEVHMLFDPTETAISDDLISNRLMIEVQDLALFCHEEFRNYTARKE